MADASADTVSASAVPREMAAGGYETLRPAAPEEVLLQFDARSLLIGLPELIATYREMRIGGRT